MWLMWLQPSDNACRIFAVLSILPFVVEYTLCVKLDDQFSKGNFSVNSRSQENKNNSQRLCFFQAWWGSYRGVQLIKPLCLTTVRLFQSCSAMCGRDFICKSFWGILLVFRMQKEETYMNLAKRYVHSWGRGPALKTSEGKVCSLLLESFTHSHEGTV